MTDEPAPIIPKPPAKIPTGRPEHHRMKAVRQKRSHREQRWREALAAYAVAPIGQPISQFCRSVGISTGTWASWCAENPEFRSRMREIQDARASYALEPISACAEALGFKLVEDALSGDQTAMANALRALGLIQAGGNVTVSTQVGVGVHSGSTVEDLEELMREHRKRRDQVLRIAQRVESAEPDPGDPGPQANGH